MLALQQFCGALDENINLISNYFAQNFSVKIKHRGFEFSADGDDGTAIDFCLNWINNLYKECVVLTKSKQDFSFRNVQLALRHIDFTPNIEANKLNVASDNLEVKATASEKSVFPKNLKNQWQQKSSFSLSKVKLEDFKVKTKYGLIKPRSENQQRYLANILNFDISFGVGPAGCGKTYLAVAAAVQALESGAVDKILLTRPAVEAGEKLGFLPGDLAQKIDPYLRPLYDALYEMLGYERVTKLMERKVIEIAPLAYMRGRTLNDSFVILDESQNTTIEQMKMFLTRIGFNSKAVITGDITQIDLPRMQKSGLKHAIEVLAKVDGLSFNYFKSADIVRHPLVAKIVDAYAKQELKEERAEKKLLKEKALLIENKDKIREK